MTGRFRTAPADRRSIAFVWSADTAGQGWGIDEARGGMRTYATMLRNRPDFFIHSGDNIYADGAIAAEQKMPNGEIWKNVVSEAKAKPAETLAEFRGNYKYNLLDRNVLAFNREIPIFSQWDDHEVTNNWWPGEPLTRAEHQRKKYVEKNALVLASRADDVVVVQLTPEERADVPRYAPDIARRVNQIAFNSTLQREEDALEDLVRVCREQDSRGSRLCRKLQRLRLHRIAAQHTIAGLHEESALNLNGSFLLQLKESGREAAQKWIDICLSAQPALGSERGAFLRCASC